MSLLHTRLEGELVQSWKEVCLAIEQQDQLHTDMATIKAQMDQLQSDHVEERESLCGKLRQVVSCCGPPGGSGSTCCCGECLLRIIHNKP